jgi:hypothetical protein
LLTILGEGALLKSSLWGMAWKQGRIGVDNDSVEAARQLAWEEDSKRKLETMCNQG